MLPQEITTLAVLFIRIHLTCSTVLPVEYFASRNDESFNNTLDSRDNVHPITPGERQMLNYQANAYQGIFWDTAYPGGNGPRGSPEDGGCTVEEYNILAEATRNAVRLAWFSGYDLYQEDRSFNKFFVRNSVAPVGGRWTSSKEDQNAFASIRHNMLQPSRFPLHGIVFACWVKGCAGGVSAYTTGTNVTPTGWTIVFCPKFFANLRYLNEILKRDTVAEGQLGNLDIVTYEQIVLHEWLHTDLMDYSEHLVDIIDKIDENGPKRKIYGMSEARDYARKFMKGNKKHINRKIVANVENYVWYFVDKFYGKRWNWKGDDNSYPTNLPRKNKAEPTTIQANTLDLGDEFVDASALPAPTWPANCHGDLPIDTVNTNVLICDYIDSRDDPSSTSAPPTTASAPKPVVTLPPDPKNCNCNENGCTPESPSCCGNGTC